MTRVEAPSRLHFGLLALPTDGAEPWPGLDGRPGPDRRHFGGVGLMVDRPGVAVRVESASRWSAEGPLADRALRFAQAVAPGGQSAYRIVVERVGGEHTGLGVGTQLALAIGRAICGPQRSALEIAQCVGRGERSAIGIHGFDRGGLIVEAGKRAGEVVSPLVAQVPFPTNWSVGLFTPSADAAWHGGRERQAFSQLRQLGPSAGETERLCRLIVTGILPSIHAQDLEGFGEAVYEFNARVGDVFAPAQGGRYGSEAVLACVRRLRAAGFHGVGQSSWGPTVFAIIRPEEAAKAEACLREIPFVLSRGANEGGREAV